MWFCVLLHLGIEAISSWKELSNLVVFFKEIIDTRKIAE